MIELSSAENWEYIASATDLLNNASMLKRAYVRRLRRRGLWRAPELIVLLVVGGCQGAQFEAPQVEVDMSPLGCGYKWQQSGRSPGLEIDCEMPRSQEFGDAQRALAVENAWEIARERCPKACPPRTLPDPSKGPDRFPDGVCRDSRLVYSQAVLFECGR